MFIQPSNISFATVASSLASLALLACSAAAPPPAMGPDAPPPPARASADRAHSDGADAAPKDSASSGASPIPTAPALAESARSLVGTWRCSGSIYGGDGAPSPSEVTFDVRLDLNSTWLRSDFTVASGKHRYEFASYRTFDAAASQWVNVIVDNMGGHAKSKSTDGVTWTGESSGPMGKMQIKDTETLVSPAQLSLLGQYSLDAESWRTGYDLSCTK